MNPAPRDLDLPNLDEATERSEELVAPSGLACPACGGALWENAEAGVTQYRCYLGHTYALSNLLDGQWEKVESALWTAVRTMQERAALFRRASEKLGVSRVQTRYRERADEYEGHVAELQRLIAHADDLERPLN